MRRALAIALALPTGCAGLVYEVVWQQSLALLLGSDAEAAASVLALVLGGIALGYAGFGARARRMSARRALAVTAWVELGLGLHALAFPALVEGVRSLRGVGAGHFAVDLALAALLIGPPSVLLGASLPLLTQALARATDARGARATDARGARAADATRVHAALYAANTLGGGVGALAAGLALVPAFGLAGALRIGAAASIGAGVLYALLARGTEEEAPSGAAFAAAPKGGGALAPWLAAAACVGFASLALQTSALRLSALSFGAAPHAFAGVVAACVLGIGAGSLAVALLRRIPRGLLVADLALLALWMLALYAPFGDAPYWAHRLRILFESRPEAYVPFQLAVAGALLAVLGPPAALSGAALPLLFQRVHALGDAAGGAAGRLFAWNTLGAVAGALLGGYALLAWLDLHQLARIAIAAIAAATALCVAAPARAGRAALAAGLLLFCAGLAALPAWQPERLSSGAFRLRRALPESAAGADTFFARWRHAQIVFYDDDPTASVAVMDETLGDGVSDRSLVSNGKSDGAVRRDRTTMGLAALLAALFAEQSERFFVIGYGTGVTAGELAALPGDPEVQVAEISPAVIAAAPLFDAWNGGATRRGRLHVVHADAYRALAADRAGFDAIVSEPSNPWVAGVEMLFAREFLAAGRERLRPGGVYVQWLHSYESDREVMELALRTFRDVFPDASLWYGLGPDLLLVGHTAPGAPDLERLLRRAESPALRAGLTRSGIAGIPELLAHELWPAGVLRALPLPGPLHTLWHPRLRHVAARAFFAGRAAPLPISARPESERAGQQASLAGRYLATHAGWPAGERARYARELCLHRPAECPAVLAAWPDDDADAVEREALESELSARLARVSAEDRAALSQLSRPSDGRAMLPHGGDPLDRASRAARLYAEHYHHGAPFSRPALASLWRACGEPGCDAARAEAEQRIGALEPRP